MDPGNRDIIDNFVELFIHLVMKSSTKVSYSTFFLPFHPPLLPSRSFSSPPAPFLPLPSRSLSFHPFSYSIFPPLPPPFPVLIISPSLILSPYISLLTSFPHLFFPLPPPLLSPFLFPPSPPPICQK